MAGFQDIILSVSGSITYRGWVGGRWGGINLSVDMFGPAVGQRSSPLKAQETSLLSSPLAPKPVINPQSRFQLDHVAIVLSVCQESVWTL